MIRQPLDYGLNSKKKTGYQMKIYIYAKPRPP